MVTDTLKAMALGGMRDHIGGGFHRYSVDAEWRVPHFEKMLYDQAQLALAYLEAAQATGEDFYATVAEDTLGYVMRDLTDPLGGFYSAEDADSLPPGSEDQSAARKVEGAFYVWTDAEIERVLGPDAPVARQRFGIEPAGNAPHDPQGEFRGQNLLYVSQSMEDIAARTGRSPGDGLCIDPGPVHAHDHHAGEVFATVWVPTDDLAGDDGLVPPEFVWSALDCPTGIAALSRSGVGPSVLGRLAAEQVAPVHAGRAYVVACWPISSEGRKHLGGAVLVDPGSGAIVGRSRGTWIELRTP